MYAIITRVLKLIFSSAGNLLGGLLSVIGGPTGVVALIISIVVGAIIYLTGVFNVIDSYTSIVQSWFDGVFDGIVGIIDTVIPSSGSLADTWSFCVWLFALDILFSGLAVMASVVGVIVSCVLWIVKYGFIALVGAFTVWATALVYQLTQSIFTKLFKG